MATQSNFQPDAPQHCCDQMRDALRFDCAQHADPYDCPDSLVAYSPMLDRYGLIIHDGSRSMIAIAFCPWCAAGRPDRADDWFNALAAQGYDDPIGTFDKLPETYKSDLWWKQSASKGGA